MENPRRDGSGGIAVGAALAGLLALMAAANGTLVWLSGRGHRDLVRPDYYQAALDQDGSMARRARAQAPGMRIGLVQDDEGWKVETSPDSTRAEVCRLHFYRPDDGREDRMVELLRTTGAGGDVQAGGRWRGPPVRLRHGHWSVRLVWEAEGRPVMETTRPYYSE